MQIIQNYRTLRKKVHADLPFTDEAQTAVFKYPVRTAL
jgi:hypothetical protein